MGEPSKIHGIVTAVLTPLNRRGNPDLDRLQRHLRQLEQDGSDAVLMGGTTGEGPSLSVAERQTVLEAATRAAGKMQVIAQTGCASLADTTALTHHAFSLGLQAVTVMPPFFFKGVSDDGLYTYYSQVLDAVPPDGSLMLYHIPQVTQVPITLNLVQKLIDRYGPRIAGIKDSAGDIRHLREYCTRFPQLSIFTGNDQLILEALQVGAAGCVTGVVNVFAGMAAEIIRVFTNGKPEAENLQRQFTAVWKILDGYQPYTTLLKALLALRYQDSGWIAVRPPLDPMAPAHLAEMVARLQALALPELYNWIRHVDPGKMVLIET